MRRWYRKLAQTINHHPNIFSKQTKPALSLETLESRILLDATLLDPPNEVPFTYGWTDTIGGPDLESPYDITIDSIGDIIITGSFVDAVDFDPSDGTDVRTAAGISDVFVTKLNKNGGYEWTAVFGGTSKDIGLAVATDGEDNIFVTGSFIGTADFDPTAGLDEHTSQGNTDVFLTKLFSDGSYAWTVTFGGEDEDRGAALAVESSGSIIIAGDFTGTVDFDPAPGLEEVDEHAAVAFSDIFISKFNSSGSHIWSKTFGGEDYDSCVDIALNSVDALYITGRFGATVDFDPDPRFGIPFEDFHTSNGHFDIFLTKFSPFGKHSWTVTTGGEGWDQPHGLAIDPSDDAVIAGEFSETVDFDPFEGIDERISNGGRDIFVSKISGIDGTYLWTTTLGGPQADFGRGVAVDYLGNIFVTGDFNGVVDFNPDPDEEDIHTSQGMTDFFLTHINGDGSYRWTFTIGAQENDNGAAIVINPQRTFFIAGQFTQTVDFDPTDETDNHTSAGFSDLFVSSFDVNIAPVIGSMSATPHPLNRGDNLTLTTFNTNDFDGSVDTVRFYHDSDNDGLFDPDIDLLIGEGDNDETESWTWIGSSGMFPVGNNTFFAQAVDNSGETSLAVSASLRINDIPIISSFTDNPDPVIQGESLTLTAQSVNDSDGTVEKVEFYRDADNNGFLEVDNDELLGEGTRIGDDWIWSGDTTNFPATITRYFARGQDNEGAWGIIAHTVGKVNILPSIASLDDDPDPVTTGDPLILTAQNVIDPNGTITQVEFYLDSNHNDILEVNTDTLLGVDFNGGDGWSWNGPPTGFDIGMNKYFARAQDDDLSWSNIASTVGRVNDRPVIVTLDDHPDPIFLGHNLKLTAHAQDNDPAPYAGISRAEFYLDTNNNGFLDFGVDRLLTIDTTDDGWFWFGPTTGFPLGVNNYFARIQDIDGAWSAIATASGTIEAFEITAGLDTGKTVKYTDSDNSEVTLKLNNGSANLTFDGNGLQQEIKGSTITIIGKADLLNVQLLNSSAKTNLTFNVRKGDGQTTLQGLSGHNLGKLNGKNLDLTGDIDLTGSLSALTLDDIAPNVSVTTGAASARGMKIKIDQISSAVEFDLHDSVKNFQSSTYAGGSFAADLIQMFKVKSGSLGADVMTNLGEIKNLFAFDNINGDVNAATFITKITSKVGGIGPDAEISAQMGDIQKVTTAQTIAGSIMSHQSIFRIVSKFGGFNGAAHAGEDIGKIQAGNFSGAVVSAGNDVNQVKANGNIDDTFIMAGFNMSFGNILGLGDGEVINVSATGTFKGSFISAGVLPPVPELQTVLPGIQPPFTGLGYLGNINKVKFGAIDQNSTTDFGLFAAGSIDPVHVGNKVYVDSDLQLNFRVEDFLG